MNSSSKPLCPNSNCKLTSDVNHVGLYMHHCRNGDKCTNQDNTVHLSRFLHPASSSPNLPPPQYIQGSTNSMQGSGIIFSQPINQPQQPSSIYPGVDQYSQNGHSHGSPNSHQYSPQSHTQHGHQEHTKSHHTPSIFSKEFPACKDRGTCKYIDIPSHHETHPCIDGLACQKNDMDHLLRFYHHYQGNKAITTSANRGAPLHTKQGCKFLFSPGACIPDEAHMERFYHICPNGDQCLLLNDNNHLLYWVHECTQGLMCPSMGDTVHSKSFIHHSNQKNLPLIETMQSPMSPQMLTSPLGIRSPSPHSTGGIVHPSGVQQPTQHQPMHAPSNPHTTGGVVHPHGMQSPVHSTGMPHSQMQAPPSNPHMSGIIHPPSNPNSTFGNHGMPPMPQNPHSGIVHPSNMGTQQSHGMGSSQLPFGQQPMHGQQPQMQGNQPPMHGQQPNTQTVIPACPNFLNNCPNNKDAQHCSQFRHPCPKGGNCQKTGDETHRAYFVHPCSKKGNTCTNKSLLHMTRFVHPCPNKDMCSDKSFDHIVTHSH